MHQGYSETWDQCTLEVNLGNEDVLIPGPIGARCVTVDHLRLDLGLGQQAPSLTMLPG